MRCPAVVGRNRIWVLRWNNARLLLCDDCHDQWLAVDAQDPWLRAGPAWLDPALTASRASR
jgi:hypothetical protein